jgi:GxxExxY protein
VAREVIGAAIEVHRHLGPGFLEGVYEEALLIELTLRGIPFEKQRPVPVSYKERNVGEGRVDLLAWISTDHN